jgi:hypothetical protein
MAVYCLHSFDERICKICAKLWIMREVNQQAFTVHVLVQPYMRTRSHTHTGTQCITTNYFCGYLHKWPAQGNPTKRERSTDTAYIVLRGKILVSLTIQMPCNINEIFWRKKEVIFMKRHKTSLQFGKLPETNKIMMFRKFILCSRMLIFLGYEWKELKSLIFGT